MSDKEKSSSTPEDVDAEFQERLKMIEALKQAQIDADRAISDARIENMRREDAARREISSGSDKASGLERADNLPKEPLIPVWKAPGDNTKSAGEIWGNSNPKNQENREPNLESADKMTEDEDVSWQNPVYPEGTPGNTKGTETSQESALDSSSEHRDQDDVDEEKASWENRKTPAETENEHEEETKKVFEVGDNVTVVGENGTVIEKGDDGYSVKEMRTEDGKNIYKLSIVTEGGTEVSMVDVSEEDLLKWQQSNAEIERSKEDDKFFNVGQKVKILRGENVDGRVWIIAKGPNEKNAYVIQAEEDSPDGPNELDIAGSELEALVTTTEGGEVVTPPQHESDDLMEIKGLHDRDKVMVELELGKFDKGWVIIGEAERPNEGEELYIVEKDGERKKLDRSQIRVEPIPTGDDLEEVKPPPPDVEPTDPGELEKLREEYVKMLMRKESLAIWRRPSSGEELQIETEYQKKLMHDNALEVINQVLAEMPSGSPEEMQNRALELMSIKLSKEDRILAGVGADIYQEGRLKRAERWLRKHPGLRMIAGLGLTGASVATAIAGPPFWPATAALIGARSALGGASAYVATGGVIDWAQKRRDLRKGDTSLVTAEQIAAMSPEEVKMRLSGNLADKLRTGTEFEDDPQRSQMLAELEAQRQADMETFLQGCKAQGMDLQQTVNEFLGKRQLGGEYKRKGAEKIGSREVRGFALKAAIGTGTGIILALIGGHKPPTPSVEHLQGMQMDKPFGMHVPEAGKTLVDQFLSQNPNIHVNPEQYTEMVRNFSDTIQPAGDIPGAGVVVDRIVSEGISGDQIGRILTHNGVELPSNLTY